MDFKEAYKNISKQIRYSDNNMSFKKWNKKPEDLKAAFLYVNFYRNIVNAWYRARFSYVDECTAVSIVFQYLQKNVKKISNDKKRYTGSYIYKVCFNCIRDLHWIAKVSDIDKYEVSSIMQSSEGEFDYLDNIISTNNYSREYDCFDVLKIMGIRYEKLGYSLIGVFGLRKINPRNKNVDVNPFSDVSISKKDVDSMLEDIKEELSFYIKKCRPDLYSYIEQ